MEKFDTKKFQPLLHSLTEKARVKTASDNEMKSMILMELFCRITGPDKCEDIIAMAQTVKTLLDEVIVEERFIRDNDLDGDAVSVQN